MSFSNQSYASPGNNLWISNQSAKRVQFEELDSPPVITTNKHAIYVLNDDILYYDGVPISGGGGGGGDVNGPASSNDNAAARYNGTTGKIIQDSNLIIEDTAGDSVELSGKIGVQVLPLLLATESSQKTALGLRTPNITDLGIDSTAIGFSAMSNTLGAQRCTAVGSESLLQCNGANNTCYGYQSGFNYTGIEANNICIDSPGVLGDNQTIRLGDTQTKCFIKGIYGSSGIGASQNVIIDSNGQLSSTASSGLALGGSSDTGSLLVYAGVPNTINGSFLSLDTTGNQITLNDASAGTFLKTTANESVYLGLYNGGNHGGSFNTAIGGSSMSSHTGGGNNTSIGSFALFAKTKGDSNTALGANCLQNITTGSGNIGIGSSCGSLYTTSESNNILIRNQGIAGDSQVMRLGDSSITKAYIADEFKSNSTNLRIGNQSGTSLVETTATNNVLVGNQTGISLTNQTNNCLIGAFAGRYNTGNRNAVCGSNSYNAASNTGSNNTICGASSASAMTSGSGNTFLGQGCGISVTTGASNIIMGSGLGTTLTTGSNNILIGANAAAAAETGTTRIGITATQTRAFIAGVSGVTTAGAAVACLVDASGQLGTISSSREVKENIREVEDTSFLQQLNVVNFEYITQDPDDNGKKQKQIGVIAEEIELIKPELVIMQGNGIKTVDYQYLFMSCIKEVQKLSKQLAIMKAEVDLLKLKI